MSLNKNHLFNFSYLNLVAAQTTCKFLQSHIYITIPNSNVEILCVYTILYYFDSLGWINVKKISEISKELGGNHD